MAGLVSMARSPEALKKDASYGTSMPMADTADQPVYPWGLCITLCDKELEKLKLDCDCEVGDEITFVVRGEVTSVSQNKSTEGPKSRLELQIVAMKVAGGNEGSGQYMPDGDLDDRKSKRYSGYSPP